MFIEQHCTGILNEVSEDQFRFILTWIVSREQFRDTAVEAEAMWNIDRHAAIAWEKILGGVPFEEAMSDPIPVRCVEAVRQIVDRLRAVPDASERADFGIMAQRYPLICMGWDPGACTMDWVVAAHVAEMLHVGSKEAANCDLTWACKEWLYWNDNAAKEGEPRRHYNEGIMSDTAYRCKWPMPGLACPMPWTDLLTFNAREVQGPQNAMGSGASTLTAIAVLATLGAIGWWAFKKSDS